MQKLTRISEHSVGGGAPLNWDDAPPDFLKGIKAWDSNGDSHMEGQQQDGTPWGDSCVQLGTVVARRTTSIVLNRTTSTLH